MDENVLFSKKSRIIAYRIVPDKFSWNVVAVKKRGELSKKPGAEFIVPVSFHKSIGSAALYLYDLVARSKFSIMQKIEYEKTGKIGEVDKMLRSFFEASLVVNHALEDLVRRLDMLGYDLNDVEFRKTAFGAAGVNGWLDISVEKR